MGFAQQIADLTKSVNGLITTVKGQFGIWENKINSKISFLTLSVSRNLTPLRVPNKEDGIVPSQLTMQEGWHILPECTVSEYLVSHAREWNDRTESEKELLTLMGAENQKYLYRDFVITTIEIDDLDEKYILGFHFLSVNVTAGAYVKLLEGDEVINRSANRLFEHAELNKWTLVGAHRKSFNKTDYTGTHLYKKAGKLKIAIALPAVVTGQIDLTEPNNWGHFMKGGLHD